MMTPDLSANSTPPLSASLSFWLFLAFWLTLMFVGRSSMFRDSDTFWHVRVGEDIISTRHIPQADGFSFTRNGQNWTSDYWPAEIAMAAIHRLAGWDGLLTVTAAILAGTYAFVATRLLRGGVNWLAAGAILALTFLASSHQFHVRPLILTLAGVAISLNLLLEVEAGRKSLRHCWLFAPLFVLWANMHGGVLAGGKRFTYPQLPASPRNAAYSAGSSSMPLG